MKKSNKRRKNPVIFVLYAISILLGIYTIYSVYNSYEYISGLVGQGLVISDELSSVITYYVGTSAPYLFYTIATGAIGYIIDKLNYISSFVNITSSEELKEVAIDETTEEIIEELEEEIISEDDEVVIVEDIKTEI